MRNPFRIGTLCFLCLLISLHSVNISEVNSVPGTTPVYSLLKVRPEVVVGIQVNEPYPIDTTVRFSVFPTTLIQGQKIVTYIEVNLARVPKPTNISIQYSTDQIEWLDLETFLPSFVSFSWRPEMTGQLYLRCLWETSWEGSSYTTQSPVISLYIVPRVRIYLLLAIPTAILGVAVGIFLWRRKYARFIISTRMKLILMILVPLVVSVIAYCFFLQSIIGSEFHKNGVVPQYQLSDHIISYFFFLWFTGIFWILFLSFWVIFFVKLLGDYVKERRKS